MTDTKPPMTAPARKKIGSKPNNRTHAGRLALRGNGPPSAVTNVVAVTATTAEVVRRRVCLHVTDPATAIVNRTAITTSHAPNQLRTPRALVGIWAVWLVGGLLGGATAALAFAALHAVAILLRVVVAWVR